MATAINGSKLMVITTDSNEDDLREAILANLRELNKLEQHIKVNSDISDIDITLIGFYTENIIRLFSHIVDGNFLVPKEVLIFLSEKFNRYIDDCDVNSSVGKIPDLNLIFKLTSKRIGKRHDSYFNKFDFIISVHLYVSGYSQGYQAIPHGSDAKSNEEIEKYLKSSLLTRDKIYYRGYLDGKRKAEKGKGPTPVTFNISTAMEELYFEDKDSVQCRNIINKICKVELSTQNPSTPNHFDELGVLCYVSKY